MSYISLTDSHEWKLRDDEQNILDWEIRDSDDHSLGRVTDLLINTDTEYVETVMLDDGTGIPASRIHLDPDEKIAYVERHDGEREDSVDGAGDREPVQPGADAYTEDFRTHYEATYASADIPYTTYYEPAYLYGFRAATQEQFKDRTFEDVEGDLRADFDNRFQNRRYSELREAIRYGYQRAHNR